MQCSAKIMWIRHRHRNLFSAKGALVSVAWTLRPIKQATDQINTSSQRGDWDLIILLSIFCTCGARAKFEFQMERRLAEGGKRNCAGVGVGRFYSAAESAFYVLAFRIIRPTKGDNKKYTTALLGKLRHTVAHTSGTEWKEYAVHPGPNPDPRF